MSLNPLSLLGKSIFPFIDEGDGLTSERERVRMLLSLVAHAGGVHEDGRHPQHYWMSVVCRRLRRLVSGMADVGTSIYC